ncbi:MAG: phosphomannomutase/phosphoglucomutase [Candidatus Woesearchaeota archaeon]|nr:phosphomannomutase/phosphoglucomutase [Candidatus Woesearchaeota archaeon]
MSGIFKAYDVRGIYPTELNEDVAYKVGKAFVSLIKPKNVVIGRDMRLSSDSLFNSLSKGITEMGADVIEIGLCSSDMVYFAVGFYKYDAGIMITASHNPKEYNGLKFVKKGAVPISSETGLREIEKIAEKNDFKAAKNKGKITKKDVMQDYIKNILKFVDIKKIKPLKVVVDAGNGMAGKVMPEIAKHLPIKLIPLYFKLDGSFPNHIPNPVFEESTIELKKTIRREKADLGLAFDGDADRVGLIDEKEKFVPGALTTAMVAKKMLSKHPGAKIIYSSTSSWIVAETIKKCKGKPIMSPVGHSFIKQWMRNYNALFGGEGSGHYYYQDNFYADSAFITALIVMEMISEEKKPLSKILEQYKKYFAIEETNFEVEDKGQKIKEIMQKYSSGKINDIDGIRIEFDDWWFSVRASGTEPLLRLNLEAKSKKVMEEKARELKNIITEN